MNFTSSIHPMAYAPGLRLRIRVVTGLPPGTGIAGHRRDLRHLAFLPLSRVSFKARSAGVTPR